jgi:uncharacterized membrane protein
MTPLLVLLITTTFARLAGWLGFAPTGSWSGATAIGLAVMFAFTGAAHVHQRRRAGMVNMVPPGLPRPDLLVTVTGVLQFAGALGLLLPATRVAAAICLGLLLVAMFPANWYTQTRLKDPRLVSMPLWARTLTQVLFIAACLLAALDGTGDGSYFRPTLT